MNVPHDILRSSLADYVLGLLPADEAQRLDAHLADGCAECEAELVDLRETLALLATTAPVVPAPVGARGRIFAAIHAEGSKSVPAAKDPFLTPGSTDGGSAGLGGADRPQAPQPGGHETGDVRTIFRMPIWGRAAIAGLAAACALLFFDSRQLRQEQVGLRNEVVLARTRIVQLESRVSDTEKWAELVTNSGSQFAQLAPTPDGDADMVAWAIYDPSSRRAAVVVDKAAAPEGRDFELWAIEGGAPRSLGVFQADADGRAVVQVEAVGGGGQVAAFAVSQEPKGGSPDKTAPSGPIVLVGALGE